MENLPNPDISQETNPLKETDIPGSINKSNKFKNKDYSSNSFFIIMLASFFALSVAISFAFFTNGRYDIFQKVNHNYGCFINVDEVGTTAYVYKYPKRTRKNNIPKVSKLLKSENFLPPLGDIEIDENLEAEMESILIFCENGIISESSSTANILKTPVFLSATDGMRKLNKTNQNKKLKIMRDTIKKTNFLYNEQWSKVISAKDENIYRWIAVNNISNILSVNDKGKKLLMDPLGILTLTEKTLNIVFLPKNSDLSKIKDNIINLKLGNLQYNLYTKSYNKYSLDNIYKKTLQYLIEKDGNKNDTINHPCLLKGWKETFFDNNHNKKYNFIGKGDSEKCKEIIKIQIDKKDCNNNNSYFCSLNNELQPKINDNQKFYATIDFTITPKFFEFKQNINYSPQDLFNETKKFCAEKWKNIVKKNKKKNYESLKIHCFNGNYIYNLLVYGFGFDENKKNIYFSNKIDKEEINWDLGGMIYDTYNFNKK